MSIKKQFIILAVYFFLPLALHAQEIIDISINGISEGVRTTRLADRNEAIMDAKLQAMQKAGVNISALTGHGTETCITEGRKYFVIMDLNGQDIPYAL